MTSDPILGNERFNVVQFFDDGTYEYVRRNVDAKEAVDAARHYTRSIAVTMRVVNQVIITDMMDQTVFHWKIDEGIVFPRPAEMESLGHVEKKDVQ